MTDRLTPLGMPYLWPPGALWLNAASDALICIAYLSIPFTLIYLARKRTDLRGSWVLRSFAAFAVAIGASHLMLIWTIWHPSYWLSGGIQAVTAVASVLTALLLMKMVPAAVRIPTPEALAAANADIANLVAERRRWEDEVREGRRSDELLTLTLASMRDGVIVTNDEGLTAFVNTAAARLTGWEVSAAMNVPIASILHVVDPSSGTRIEPEDAPSSVQRESARHLLLVAKDGKERYVDLQVVSSRTDRADIRATVYMMRDCSESKLVDDLQQRMSALVESAEDAIITKTLDGVIRSWNTAAERLLGYRADEIIGQPISQLLPEDRQEEESLILGGLRQGQKFSHFETIRRRKDGSLVDVSLTISPIRDRGGSVVGASKIMRDITERKAYLEELRRLNADLESRVLARTAELHERDVMIQEIHHRVKNNLQVISSLINMQIRSINDSGVRVALRQCQSRVETMAQIHEMLYQSRDYARVPFWRYARELATRVLTAFGPTNARVSVSYQMDQEYLAVGQAIPCGLILNELISNALKHAFPADLGSLHVGFQRIRDNRIRLSVSDDGAGLPAGFDPAKSNSLGMTLVAALTKQLDGVLEILHTPCTTFCVTFPGGLNDE